MLTLELDGTVHSRGANSHFTPEELHLQPNLTTTTVSRAQKQQKGFFAHVHHDK